MQQSVRVAINIALQEDQNFVDRPLLKDALTAEFISACKNENKTLKACIFVPRKTDKGKFLEDCLDFNIQRYCSWVPFEYCMQALVPMHAFRENPKLKLAYEAIMANPCAYLPEKEEIRHLSIQDYKKNNYFGAGHGSIVMMILIR